MVKQDDGTLQPSTEVPSAKGCCCSKIAEAEAGVSVNEKKWLVMHMHLPRGVLKWLLVWNLPALSVTLHCMVCRLPARPMTIPEPCHGHALA
jgi:hypothetical protein